MGELILLYYLKIFNIFIITFLLLILFYYYKTIYVKEYDISNKLIKIEKGQNINYVINKYFKNNNILENIIFKIHYKIFKKNIHFGEFKIINKITFNNILIQITSPSSNFKKITIIEGWSKKDLNNILQNKFEKINSINFEDILADTYYYDVESSFYDLQIILNNFKIDYFEKYKNNKLFEKYSIKDIITIGSLIEKEGLDKNDKLKISSVIFNRLNKNMRLQIDASVIYSLTDGKYDLNRKINLQDLKFQHPYNTYVNNGLPPGPISYVGTKTIDLILENYKTEYFYYFFDERVGKHIFSKNYKEHVSKLNEYRKSK